MARNLNSSLEHTPESSLLRPAPHRDRLGLGNCSRMDLVRRCVSPQSIYDLCSYDQYRWCIAFLFLGAVFDAQMKTSGLDPSRTIQKACRCGMLLISSVVLASGRNYTFFKEISPAYVCVHPSSFSRQK